MKIKDNTILRIKVPAHLYESVKAQLTLKEAKGNYGVPEGTVIKEKSASGGDKPKKTSAKKPAAPKAKAEAPKKGGKVPHDGMQKANGKKEHSLDELKKIHEMLGERIAEMEGSGKSKPGKFNPGKRNFTYKDKTGKTKYGTADDIDQARAWAEENGEDPSTVRMDENRQSIKESIMDAKIAVNIIKDALAKGQSVEINGENVAKIVPLAAAISTDSQTVYRLAQMDDLSIITVDGQPLTDLISAKSATVAAMPKPAPTPVDPEAEKAWMDRYGPGGGYETGFGRYTGD